MSDEFLIKKSKKKVIFLILFILIIISLLGFGGYHFFQKRILNPNKFLEKSTKLTQKYVNSIFDNFDFLNNKLTGDQQYTGSIKLNNNDNKNNYKIDFDIISSIKKEELNMNLAFLENDTNILKTLFIFKDKNIYLDAKDLYDKILLINKTEEDIYSYFKEADSSLSFSDFRLIIDKNIKYFFEALKESKSSSKLLKINKVEYTYEINNENKDKIQNRYQELLKNDKELSTILEKYADILNFEFEPVNIEIVVDILTNKIYSLKIENTDSKLLIERDSANKYTFKSNDITGTIDVSGEKIKIQTFQDEILEATIELINDNKLLSISYTTSDMDFTFSIKNKVSINNVNFVVKTKEFVLDLSGEITKLNDGYDCSFLLDYKAQDEKIQMNVNLREKIAENLLESKDLSNYVEFNTLTDNQKYSIYSKLYSAFEKLGILSDSEINKS